MNRTFSRIALAAGLAVFALGAHAQSIQANRPPQVQAVGPADLFQDVVGGSASAQSYYASAGQIAAQSGLSVQVPLTGFTIQLGNNQPGVFLTPAGTLAAGTFDLPLQPADTQKACFVSSQIQTALTVAAPSGATIGGTAFTVPVPLGTLHCWLYSQSLNEWFHLTQN